MSDSTSLSQCASPTHLPAQVDAIVDPMHLDLLCGLAQDGQVVVGSIADCKRCADQHARRAGAVPVNWFALACELQRDWRQGGERLLNVCLDHLPHYNHLVQSKK
jgi:hypothetical protein